MTTNFLLTVFAFLVFTSFLAATSTMLLVPAYRNQMCSTVGARMSATDSQYFKSFILTLSEI
jgi:hypothetical protein